MSDEERWRQREELAKARAVDLAAARELEQSRTIRPSAGDDAKWREREAKAREGADERARLRRKEAGPQIAPLLAQFDQPAPPLPLPEYRTLDRQSARAAMQFRDRQQPEEGPSEVLPNFLYIAGVSETQYMDQVCCVGVNHCLLRAGCGFQMPFALFSHVAHCASSRDAKTPYPCLQVYGDWLCPLDAASCI